VVPGHQRDCAANYGRHLITKGFCVNQKVLVTTKFCSSFLRSEGSMWDAGKLWVVTAPIRLPAGGGEETEPRCAEPLAGPVTAPVGKGHPPNPKRKHAP
jgi:hypothetical protein